MTEFEKKIVNSIEEEINEAIKAIKKHRENGNFYFNDVKLLDALLHMRNQYPSKIE
jgi:hypothetical protein